MIFDTCILIDYLQGVKKAAVEIKAHETPMISAITYAEVLAGADTAETKRTALGLLAHFEVVVLDKDLAERAAQIRRDMKMKLPDAIIFATAVALSTVVVTRDQRFGKGPYVRQCYRD
jgi:predicted nucleic acid-binding protein